MTSTVPDRIATTGRRDLDSAGRVLLSGSTACRVAGR